MMTKYLYFISLIKMLQIVKYTRSGNTFGHVHSGFLEKIMYSEKYKQILYTNNTGTFNNTTTYGINKDHKFVEEAENVMLGIYPISKINISAIQIIDVPETDYLQLIDLLNKKVEIENLIIPAMKVLTEQKSTRNVDILQVDYEHDYVCKCATDKELCPLKVRAIKQQFIILPPVYNEEEIMKKSQYNFYAFWRPGCKHGLGPGFGGSMTMNPDFIATNVTIIKNQPMPSDDSKKYMYYGEKNFEGFTNMQWF